MFMFFYNESTIFSFHLVYTVLGHFWAFNTILIFYLPILLKCKIVIFFLNWWHYFTISSSHGPTECTVLWSDESRQKFPDFGFDGSGCFRLLHHRLSEQRKTEPWLAPPAKRLQTGDRLNFHSNPFKFVQVVKFALWAKGFNKYQFTKFNCEINAFLHFHTNKN